jgi:hypothetical protein
MSIRTRCSSRVSAFRTALLVVAVGATACLPEGSSNPTPGAGSGGGSGSGGGNGGGTAGGEGGGAGGGTAGGAGGGGGGATGGGAGGGGAGGSGGSGPVEFVAPEPHITCPGGDGCAAGGDAQLRVGASARDVSDLGFELPRYEYIEPWDRCNEAHIALHESLDPAEQSALGMPRCGELLPDFVANCGTDRLCPGDDGYVEPDADGSEMDFFEDTGEPRYDYFHDCGADMLCPGDDGYPGPDVGEGNGIFDGLWLAGFQNNRPALGVMDPLWARTVAVEQGNTLVTMTSIDAIGIFWDDIRRIRERARALLAEQAPEVDLDYMMVSSTHNHEAPDTSGQWAGEVDPEIDIPLVSGVNQRYIEYVREQAAQSIVEAVLDRRSADMKIARVNTGAAGLLRDSRDPVVIDDQLGIVQFTEAGTDVTIATMANWGNHPEAMSDVNNFITSDFPHGLRVGLEAGVPETIGTEAREGLGGVAVYFQGSVGGLMTPLRVEVPDLQGETVQNYTFLRAYIMGYRLAEHALDAITGADAETVDAPTLSVTAARYLVPVYNRVFWVGISVNLFNRDTHGDYDPDSVINDDNLPFLQSEAAIIRLGPLTMYTVPGELFPELAIGGLDGSKSFEQALIRPDNPNPPDLDLFQDTPYHEMMPGEHKWTLGLGNDFIGYIVPPYDYELHPSAPYFEEADGDHYEETNSVGPEAEPRLRRVLERLLQAITGE